MNREWTEEEFEILRRDRAAKIPVPVIAAKLNRPVPATYLRARMIGTQVQQRRTWDEESVARLRALVNADPPMTDKQIAEDLGRTVTQIRWKMQDLGLIGIRDLSKLAKVAAASSARQRASKDEAPAPRRPVRHCAPEPASPQAEPRQPAATPARITPEARLEREIARLADVLAEQLKGRIAEAEAGTMQAALATIAEKKAIDARLAGLAPQATRPKAEEAGSKQAPSPRTPARSETSRAAPDAAAERPAPVKSLEKKPSSEALAATPGVAFKGRAAADRVARPVMPALARQARTATAPAAPAPAALKVVVVDTPAPAREPSLEPPSAQISGRGGWKTVRRDPSRVPAQGRTKATSRADAMDLAQAAQTAIEQFIAQRGVTRGEVCSVQALVTRLQARGYIVVGEGDGWIIDQRHRVAGIKELEAFAAARGITLDAAA